MAKNQAQRFTDTVFMSYVSPNLIQVRLSNAFILQRVKAVLDNNNFTFNGRFYKQLKGTTMGTKFALIWCLDIGITAEYTPWERFYGIIKTFEPRP